MLTYNRSDKIQNLFFLKYINKSYKIFDTINFYVIFISRLQLVFQFQKQKKL